MEWLVLVLYGFDRAQCWEAITSRAPKSPAEQADIILHARSLSDKYDVSELAEHAEDSLTELFILSLRIYPGEIDESIWQVLGRVFTEGTDDATWAKENMIELIQIWHHRFIAVSDLEEKLLHIPRLAVMLAVSSGMDGKGCKLRG